MGSSSLSLWLPVSLVSSDSLAIVPQKKLRSRTKLGGNRLRLSRMLRIFCKAPHLQQQHQQQQQQQQQQYQQQQQQQQQQHQQQRQQQQQQLHKNNTSNN